MSLKDQLKKAVTESMKARTAPRTQALRMALSGIQKKEIDAGKDLTDDEATKTLATQIKQIQESIEQARTAGREDLTAAAEAEIVILREFLPQQMSDAEVQKIVQGIVEQLKAAGTLPAGPASLGPVMKQSMAQIGSRAEGKVIQGAVRQALGLA